MTMFQNILFPTDFSQTAGHAGLYAIAFARQYGSRLHVLHVVDYKSVAHGPDRRFIVDPVVRHVEQGFQADVDAIVAGAKTLNIEAHGHITFGDPVSEVLRLAEEEKCDLVVLGTHGRSGIAELVFGSTYRSLFRDSPIPVLGVKHPEREFVGDDFNIRLERVMCPIDFSGKCKGAMRLAIEQCKEFGATLSLLAVLDMRLAQAVFPSESHLDGWALCARVMTLLAETADGIQNIPVEFHVRVGVPHREIALAVKQDAVDLVVMAPDDLEELSDATTRHTTERAARIVNCPILTVRPQGRARTRKGVDEPQFALLLETFVEMSKLGTSNS